ncbi:MAG TPA: DUF5995 family protein [Polyangiaceae bacterium]|jgi:hypothetical protein|nr:DUF5995 family protein [Polyangiaceae bacterium]
MLAANIDEVVTLLDGVIAEFRERRSTLAFFPALYRAVTLRVRTGIASAIFADGPRMNRLDTAFANRYFIALDEWRARGTAPRAWRAAFATETRPSTMILQHLLLGMNAHINFDLPVATIGVAQGTALAELEVDFLAINDILAAALDDVQDVLNEFSPMLDILDRVGGSADEALCTFSIVNAREEAWHEATRLSGEGDDIRQRSIVSLDRRVAVLSDRIILPGGPCGLAVDLIARTENEDVKAVTDALLKV